MFAKTSSALFFLPLWSFLFISKPVQASDYPSCLAEKLKGITHEAAVKAITEACQAQYSNRAASKPNRDPIRATLIDGRFRDNGDGTVTDTKTNLVWMRCSLGQQWIGTTCKSVAVEVNWNDALSAAMSHSFAGHSDWRVPTIDELETLVQCPVGRKPLARPGGHFVRDTDGACHGRQFNNPKINIDAFPSTPASSFWSSSPSVYGSGTAWFVNFDSGGIDVGKGVGPLVRLVRAGQ